MFLTAINIQLLQDYRMFVCFACGRVFDDEITMRDHVNEIHLSNKVCLFSSNDTLQRLLGGIREEISTF